MKTAGVTLHLGTNRKYDLKIGTLVRAGRFDPPPNTNRVGVGGWDWGGGRGGRPPPLTGFPGFPARPVSLLLMFLFHAWQRGGGGARLRRWTLQAKLPQDPSELHTRDAKNANNGMFPLAIVNCPCSNLPYEESGSGFLEGQPTHQGWGRIPPGGTPLKKRLGRPRAFPKNIPSFRAKFIPTPPARDPTTDRKKRLFGRSLAILCNSAG